MSEPAVPVAALRALVKKWEWEEDPLYSLDLAALCDAHEPREPGVVPLDDPHVPESLVPIPPASSCCSEVGGTREAFRGQGEQALRSQGAHT